jgi:hypothetical protein
LVEKLKIPIPKEKPRDLGKDFLGRSIGAYTPEEYKVWKGREDRLSVLRAQSRGFRERARKIFESTRESNQDEKEGTLVEKHERATEGDIEEERARRREIAQSTGKGAVLRIANEVMNC